MLPIVTRFYREDGVSGDGVRALHRIRAGETVLRLTGEVVDAPTKYTIQLDADRHILGTNETWKYLNHACVPNIRVDTESREIVAVTEIAAGEELRFNYNTTEWAMACAFECDCGAPGCVRSVRGFSALTDAQREAIRHFLSPFILRRWDAAIEAGDGRAESVDLRSRMPEVQVLVPYESLECGGIASTQYDTEAFRAEVPGWFAPLGLDHVWRPVTLRDIDAVREALLHRRREREIVVLNLCDGTEVDQMPGRSVVRMLTEAGLPFTGADEAFYEITTSKLATKRLLAAAGVPHPVAVEIVDDAPDVARAVEAIGFPLLVKPDVSAGSYGLHVDSVCHDIDSALRAAARLREEVGGARVFAEPFIRGREFTCFIVEDEHEPDGLWVLPPGERVFDSRLPVDERFLVYERYWSLPGGATPLPDGEPFYWYQLAPPELRGAIAGLARRAMRAVGGCGYGRVDMRLSDSEGQLYVLEVNSQCGLSASEDATVGSVLRLSGVPIWDVVERILRHALTRAASAFEWSHDRGESSPVPGHRAAME